ncbi:MAG: hypothetical protein H0X65_03980 [Gemmatimonadetes bacterium]|nr:hypothetical protein [Gemmatimonadota bacterium]
MSDAPATRGAHSPEGVARARVAFVAWVDEAGPRGREFLQIVARSTGAGRYEVLHREDADHPGDGLLTHTDPYAARPIAQTTASGDHRPLKTAPNLRTGWRIADLDASGLCVVLDYLYPACLAHWYSGRTGSLRVTHWRETANRQSGIYSPVQLLSDQAVRDTVWACCDDSVCLRRVAWRIDETTPLGVSPDAPDRGADVPCPEACSLFTSLARTVLTLERSPRDEVPGLGALGTREVEQIREVVGAAAGGTLGVIREGDFAEGANARRIRYLAARLRASEAPAAADDLPCEECPRSVPCAGCPLAA